MEYISGSNAHLHAEMPHKMMATRKGTREPKPCVEYLRGSPASELRELDVKATYNLWSRLKWKLATIGFYLNRISALPRAQRLFRDVERGTLLERNLFGHRFVCDVSRAGPQKLLYLIGERHVSEANLVRSLLAPGMNVVDVGANIGYYTLMFAQVVGPQGRIIAIESSPENLPELTLNVERDNLRNVEIVAKAVGDTQKGVGLSSGINSERGA